MVSSSVAVLLALLVSETVAGGVTVALLTAFCDQASGLAAKAKQNARAAAIQRRDEWAMRVGLASTETSPWTRPAKGRDPYSGHAVPFPLEPPLVMYARTCDDNMTTDVRAPPATRNPRVGAKSPHTAKARASKFRAKPLFYRSYRNQTPDSAGDHDGSKIHDATLTRLRSGSHFAPLCQQCRVLNLDSIHISTPGNLLRAPMTHRKRRRSPPKPPSLLEFSAWQAVRNGLSTRPGAGGGGETDAQAIDSSGRVGRDTGLLAREATAGGLDWTTRPLPIRRTALRPSAPPHRHMRMPTHRHRQGRHRS